MYSIDRHGPGSGLGCWCCPLVDPMFPPSRRRFLAPRRYKSHMPRAMRMRAMVAPMAIPAAAPAERTDAELGMEMGLVLVLELVLPLGLAVELGPELKRELDPVVAGTSLLAPVPDVCMISNFSIYQSRLASPSMWLLLLGKWERTEAGRTIGIPSAYMLCPGTYVSTQENVPVVVRSVRTIEPSIRARYSDAV